jgi:hypothetical protein
MDYEQKEIRKMKQTKETIVREIGERGCPLWVRRSASNVEIVMSGTRFGASPLA